MSFNLQDAPESNFNNQNGKVYQKPGIFDNVKITEVVLGESSLNHVPYMELRTEGENGEIGKSNHMWLGTTIGINLDGSPKKTSGWGVTARNLIDLIVATHNIPREEAKMIELVPSGEDNKEKLHAMLAAKVSSLLVGKPFRAKFKGQESKPNDRGNIIIFSSLDVVESMQIPAEKSTLRFNPAYDIKLNEVPQTEESTTQDAKANDGFPY